jgi:aminoglycoside phosphotransferase (APT) family kinase protein
MTEATTNAEPIWLSALSQFLAERMPQYQAPWRAEKFSGGQSNPTYLLTDARDQRLVLRRKPSGVLLASAHAVDREFRIMQALHAQDFPVAKVHLLCMDETVIGSAFYLMEYLSGRVFWNPALPEIDAQHRGDYYQSIAEVLRRLHAFNPAVIGLADYGKPGNYFARQLKRWTEQYQASLIETDADSTSMRELIAGLNTHLPTDDGQSTIVHGDFRIDNLMFDTHSARIVAVMDWELSTLGHPLADASYFCMALRLPKNPVLPGLAGIDRLALGIPSEAEWLANYQNSNSDRENFHYYLAFNFFRLAAIAQGVKKRATLGNASNTQASAQWCRS